MKNNHLFEPVLQQVEKYYSNKIGLHGATPQGADWNSIESQELRFAQLAHIFIGQESFSINDFGCGYGALLGYLRERYSSFQYNGFDISESMVTMAQKLYAGTEYCTWTTELSGLPLADYTVASGIFNVKLETDEATWKAYILSTLDQLSAKSLKGFSFNILTLYSDIEKRRPDLYYADPLVLFDHCKRKYSRFVALLHDYPLYEFTILVRK